MIQQSQVSPSFLRVQGLSAILLKDGSWLALHPAMPGGVPQSPKVLFLSYTMGFLLGWLFFKKTMIQIGL